MQTADSIDPPDELSAASGAAPEQTGRVLAVHGEQSLVEVESELVRCYLSGRLKFRRSVDSGRATGEHWRRDRTESRGRWTRSRESAPVASPVAVGDLVRLRRSDEKTGTILSVLDRKSWLGRVRPTKGPQVIAANVEIALIVTAVAEPEPNFLLLDQFLIQAAAGGLEPWIVFNKVDLLQKPPLIPPHAGGSGSAPSPLAGRVGEGSCGDYEEAQFYRGIGYRVFCTSSETGAGIEALENALRGRTAVLVGSSGVGKSTLLNDLIPEANARLGEISEWSGRGQHTTTHVAMYPLPGGGYIVDAPGIRRLSLWQVSAAQLPSFFPEFAACAEQCSYHGCTHVDEAECAVRSAAESGLVPWRRYQHYRQMRAGRGGAAGA